MRVGPDRLEWGGPSGLADGLRGKWPAWLPLLTPLLTLFKTEKIKRKKKGRKERLEKEFGHGDNFHGLIKNVHGP